MLAKWLNKTNKMMCKEINNLVRILNNVYVCCVIVKMHVMRTYVAMYVCENNNDIGKACS